MTHTLIVLGTTAANRERTRALTRRQVGPRDEVLCGCCCALIAVGHQAWQPGGSSLPGTAGAIIRCAVCDTVNDAGRAAA